MQYDFEEVKINMSELKDWLQKEYKSLSTGRATPGVLDGISIESYGSRTNIAHVASISIEDAKTLRIAPWDKGQVKQIENAINEADLGLSVSSDDAGIRVHFPMLTTETRTKLVKVLKEKLEDARVKVRQERERVIKDIDQKEKEGGMSEDDKFRFKEELQKIVTDTNNELERLFETKEKDTLTV